MTNADTPSARATRGRTQAQHRSAKQARIAVEAEIDPRSTEDLRAAAVAAWGKVTGNPHSTRWDLTKFEKVLEV